MTKQCRAMIAGAGLAVMLVWPAAGGELAGRHPAPGFELNLGQTDRRVAFISRGPAFDAFLTGNGVVLNPGDRRVAAAAWRFRGAGAAAKCEGLDRLPGISNYFIGRDPRRWVTEVPHYARVRCRDVLPGVDTVYYWREGALEYDLELRPGVDPASIRLEFAGKARPRLEANGDLVLEAGGGRTRFRKPVVQQAGAEGADRIRAAYTVESDGAVGFHVTGHDRSRKLIIDPVVVFSTYLGGPVDIRPWTQLSGTQAGGMAVDGMGNVYVTGETNSLQFPTTPWSPQPDRSALPPDFAKLAVIAKLSADGSTLLFSTYFGGADGYTVVTSVAVDGLGRVHLAGNTLSSDFPVTPDALQPVKRGVARLSDGVLALLDSAGSQLLYSSYLGGSDSDWLMRMALGPSGDLYLAGTSGSADFPLTAGAFQTKLRGKTDGVILRLNARGDQIRYSTFLGGTGDDEAVGGIVTDAQGAAYVAGWTSDSAEFPTTPGAVRKLISPSAGLDDVFVAKLNPAGTDLLYSGVFGGGRSDRAFSIGIDDQGAAYVVGDTFSDTEFNPLPTTADAFQPKWIYGGPPKPEPTAEYASVFAGKVSPAGDRLEYLTYLGGMLTAAADALVDAQGNLWIVGRVGVFAGLFPLRKPMQATRGPGDNAFLAELNTSGSDLIFSTLIGSSENDGASAIAFGPDGSVYLAGTSSFVAGSTFAGDFPTTPGAYQAKAPDAKWNMFVMRINMMATPRLDGSGIRNAASFRPGPVAPGELLSLFGLGVGSLNAIGAAPSDEGFFPTELRDTHVFFDGVEAPLLYTSAGQVNAIAPFVLEGRAVTRVQVEFAGARGNVLEIPVAPHTPALFTADASGEGQAAALNEDGAANGPAAPAAPGSVIVFFMTGGGQTVPAGIDGKVAEMNPPAPASPVEVTIGGVAAAIEYAGQAPGLVHGVWQVNARIPPGVAGDAVPVTAKVGDSSSPPGVTIAVR